VHVDFRLVCLNSPSPALHDQLESTSTITILLIGMCEHLGQGVCVAAGVSAVQQPAESS